MFKFCRNCIMFLKGSFVSQDAYQWHLNLGISVSFKCVLLQLWKVSSFTICGLYLLDKSWIAYFSNQCCIADRFFPIRASREAPRILERVAIPFSMESSQPRDPAWVSHIAGGFFPIGASREAPEYWSGQPIPSPGELPDKGINQGFPALRAEALPAELPGKPLPMVV